MATVTPAPATPTPEELYPPDRLEALKAGLAWLRNPVSINGPLNLKRMKFAAGGPETHRKVEQMRAHPDGRRILEDRPNLSVALSDMDALAAMPEGSLGRVYHDFMSHPAAVPTYMLGSLLYKDGHFDDLDWSEEMKYLVERENVTHDLTHVISGYGTHLVSEAINIIFGVGLEGGKRPGARFLATVFGILQIPRVGWRRWRAENDKAYDAGRRVHETIPFHCIYWEELLPLPLDEVRDRLGCEPVGEGLDTSDWILNPIGKAMANGYGKAGDREGKAKSAALARKLGGWNADPRDIVALIDLDEPTQERLHEAFDRGADEAELREIAGLAPRELAA